MTFGEIIQAMQIVSKYVDPDTSFCQGEHDIIFLPLANDAAISAEDAAKLDELGAHQSSKSDSWAMFT